MGSPRFRAVDTRACIVTHAWFPPGAMLAPHTHDRPIVAVMLSGGFRSDIAHRRLECAPGSVWTEPLAEIHANDVGREGARVVVMQPDPLLGHRFAPVQRLLEDVSLQRHAGIASDARRVVEEIEHGDDISPMAIDALVMSMLSVAGRLRERETRESTPPRWLLMVRDLLHDRFLERLTLDELAAAAGVQASYLARQFRAWCCMTIGEYVRRLRCDWAAARLAQTDTPISEIALRAGYSDQSHFTRQCRQYLGMSPGAYRRMHRGSR
jgi:AraC family transcriptional regulator